MHGSTIFCSFNKPLIPISVPDCTISLFTNKVNLVNLHCDFRFFPNHLTPTITELTPKSALVYHNNGSLTLNCPDSQKLIPSCSYCIVNIPCMCSLSSKTIYYAPRLVQCYTKQPYFDVNSVDTVFWSREMKQFVRWHYISKNRSLLKCLILNFIHTAWQVF